MRSPRQEATGGAMLSGVWNEWRVMGMRGIVLSCVPGSRPYLRQRTMRKHMKEPKNRHERHAADMDVEATVMNLFHGLVI